jgi:hypothetical protein
VAASLFGVFRFPAPANPSAPDLGIRIDWGIPIALALAAVLALRLRGAPRPTPRAWALLVAIGVFWALLALSIGPARSPLASRYVYPGVLLVLLLAAELAAGAGISRGWRIAVSAALAVSLFANVDTIRVGGGYFRAEGSYNRAELAALQLTRGRVADDFAVEEGSSNLLPHGDMLFRAGDYFAAIDEFGSPAYSLSQLAGAGSEQRAAADQLLGRALGLSAVPVEQLPAARGGRVEPARAALHMTARPRGRCVALLPDLGYQGRVALRLPPGGFAYRAPRGTEVQIELGRFGDGFAVKPTTVSGSAVVRIPADESPRPWRALVRSAVPLEACPA